MNKRDIKTLTYSPAEAAQALGVPVREVYRLIAAGEIGVIHVGKTKRRYRVPIWACEGYVRRNSEIGITGRRTRAA